MSSPVSYDLQGQGGGIVISALEGELGNFRWIQVITDTEFDALASTNIDSATSLVGITIPAGVGIGGNFTEIGVNTGVVIAYYA